MKSRVALAALVAVATTSAVASAQQPWIRDRRYGEGIGIRVGDLELHPGIAAEFGYDSNFFQRSGATGGSAQLDELENPITEFYRLRLTGHFNVSTLSMQRRQAEGLGGEPPSVNFQAGAHIAYNEF